MMLEVDDLLIGKDHNRIDGFLYSTLWYIDRRG